LQMPNLRLMSNFSTKCMGLGGSFGFRFCYMRRVATPLTKHQTRVGEARGLTGVCLP
jgi:hypothetical protein